MNAALVVCFEIDKDVLPVFQNNVEFQELTNVDCVNCDILGLSPRLVIAYMSIMRRILIKYFLGGMLFSIQLS